MKKIRNLLMVIADDLRPELNCFGKQELVTPNIDRLAERSIRFGRAYCQYPQCMPSRTSALTGIRPDQFCDKAADLCTAGEPTLPAFLKANGLRTISVGKVYHKPLDDAASWDQLHRETLRPDAPEPHGHWFHDYQSEENLAKAIKKASLPFARRRGPGMPPMLEAADAPEDAYLDGQIAGRASEVLEHMKETGESFFLAVGFLRPHLPWVAPKKYWDLYDRDAIDLAANPFFPRDGIGKSALCDFVNYDDPEVYARFEDIGQYEDDDFPVLSEAKQRECIHAYRASVSFMDAQLGRVLDQLEALDLADETAILFWGDNGYHLGEHKLWSKVTSFEESTRVPLMLTVPGRTAGEESQALVELLDLYPTICQLLELEPPGHLDGAPLPLRAEGPGKDAIFAVNGPDKTLRTTRYRFTFYPRAAQGPSRSIIAGRGSYELFDLQADPGENENVARSPDYADVVEELRARLNAQFPAAKG